MVEVEWTTDTKFEPGWVKFAEKISQKISDSIASLWVKLVNPV